MSENKDLWTPWEWKEFIHGAPNEEPQGTTIMDCGGHYLTHQFNLRPVEKRQEIASAIVSAVNGTWGIGVNPDAVKDLYDALYILADWVSLKDDITEYELELLQQVKAAIAKASIK